MADAIVTGEQFASLHLQRKEARMTMRYVKETLARENEVFVECMASNYMGDWLDSYYEC